MSAPRIQTPQRIEDELELDRSLRPRRLEDFVGQPSLKEQLAISIEAALARGEALDHVLLAGPPGLGKTTLAQIIAAELDAPFVMTAGPALERKADVAAFLTALEPGSVFFVDEIHRLQRALEETFYPAMEDRQLPITVGMGAGARVVTLELPPFTLIGATTRTGLLTAPLRDRFGLQHRLEHYDVDDLATIVTRSARILDVALDPDGAEAIAARSRGTPRVANRLLKRVRDYAQVRFGGVVTADAADAALAMLEIDELGLDRLDRELLRAVCEKFEGGPGRAVDARGDRRRGAGHDRGRLRALPAAVRAAQAHAARARGDAPRLRAPRAQGAGRDCRQPLLSARRDQGARLHPAFTTRFSTLRARSWPICSSAPAAETAAPRPIAPPASPARPRAARSVASAFSSSCSTTTTRPRTPRSSSATRRAASSAAAAVPSSSPASTTSASSAATSARSSASSSRAATTTSRTVLEWGVRALDKPVQVNAEGDLPATAKADLFPAYDDDGGLLLVLTPTK